MKENHITILNLKIKNQTNDIQMLKKIVHPTVVTFGDPTLNLIIVLK